jgi:hypothetical protein
MKAVIVKASTIASCPETRLDAGHYRYDGTCRHTPAKPLWTIAEIKAANKAAGGHYFERSTMQFFDSRVLSPTWPTAGKTFFVTSEQFHGSDDFAGPRLYTVRVIDWETADVDTVGEFQQHKMLRDAYAAARDASLVPA